MDQANEKTLGGFLRRTLDTQQISNNILAQSTGIAEGTVRNLLRYGIDADAPAPHPHTLRAVAEFLHLNPTHLFRLAGYITDEDVLSHLSPVAEYVGQRFDVLRPDQQKMVLDILGTLEKSNGLPNYGAVILDSIAAGKTLRQRHLTRLEWLDLKISDLLGIRTDQLMLNGIQRRLQDLFPGEAFTPDDIQKVADHPVAMAIMSVLLPRKDLPRGLDKLFYLTWFDQDREVPAATRDAIIDTWDALQRAAQIG
ncbi:MAG: hypothetical protein BroJett018_27610 [Chloroflexota bacterium]|nr:hypothetical protein [Chloroflexota bacterium]NOG63799.1 hypothetical protein [Chloroflexota bacterium]GIK64967.1 MAG: hypothetical protein BroJett018_27610 [Chloroflexota bacterium]